MREEPATYMVPLAAEEVELLEFIRRSGQTTAQRAVLARRALALLRALGDSAGHDPDSARH
jgi:hypothetical protein